MAVPPIYLAADFAQAMLNLLPRGRIWRRDPGSTLAETLTALALTYERSTASAAQLLVDTFPETTVNLLPEWEASLGLPDPCAPLNPTLLQRQEAVRAKWAERGGQSVAYFIAYAATLGYIITITQFAPFRVGISTVGQPLLGPAWANVWQVNAPSFSVEYFEVGHDTVGEPLATWGNTVLICELQRLAPAHTTLLFNLGGVVTGGSGGTSGGSSGAPQFSVSGGMIYNPDGVLHVAKGVNLLGPPLSDISTNSAAQPLSTQFSGINQVRVPVYPSNPGTGSAVYPAPATFLSFVQQLTGYTRNSNGSWTKVNSNGIVVEIEDHNQDDTTYDALPPYTGSALTVQLAWYAAMATYYAGNPYFWLGGPNEIATSDGTYGSAVIAAISTWQGQIYNAIRGTGNMNMIMFMAGVGGSNIGTVGVGGGFTPSVYAGFTNMAWELHGYYSPGDSSGSPPIYTTAAGYIAGGTSAPSSGAGGGWGIAGAQTIQSADGLVPVILGEWGSDSGNPATTEAAALTAVVAAVQAQGVGATAWTYLGDASQSWALVDGSGALTTWGAEVASTF